MGSDRSAPRRERPAVPAWGVSLALCLFALLTSRSARAWQENHVLGDEVRIRLTRAGQAEIEHRMTLKTNGSVRLHDYRIDGIDRDAEVLDNSYAIPVRDAVTGTLENAVPIRIELTRPPEGPARAVLKIEDERGLRRGTYLFVFRYRTDFTKRRAIVRRGPMAEVTWVGPRFEDGFDNARVTFEVPHAAVRPRAVERAPEEAEGAAATTVLSEVR
ncbi:MAG: hypothetical protein AAGA56_30960, partial [Myxococcota bacterium]